MGNETCVACRFFQPLDAVRDDAVGLCRHAPPAAIMVGMARDSLGRDVPAINSYWPQVRPSLWCGAWERALGTIEMSRLDLSEPKGHA